MKSVFEKLVFHRRRDGANTSSVSDWPKVFLIYSQFHDNIYIQVYTCANGLNVDIAYICPLQSVRQFKYIYIHIVTQIQKL